MVVRHKHKVTEAQSGADFLQKMDKPLEALIEVCSKTDAAAPGPAPTLTKATLRDARTEGEEDLRSASGQLAVEAIIPQVKLQSQQQKQQQEQPILDLAAAATRGLLPRTYSGASYDLILMDNRMPKMTGPEATRCGILNEETANTLLLCQQ